jgi:hypothetical protein
MYISAFADSTATLCNATFSQNSAKLMVRSAAQSVAGSDFMMKGGGLFVQGIASGNASWRSLSISKN